MARDRYVILGLARPRAPWFPAVAQWAHNASIAAEFVKCVSAEELRAKLRSGRLFSAALLDAGLPMLDRDLLETAARSGCAVIIADDPRVRRDWRSLGAAAVLPEGFGRAELTEALAAHAPLVSRADAVPPEAGDPPMEGASLGSVAIVCGSGGTGASTVAIALAQGLAELPAAGDVVLADLALRGEQSLLHDARDVIPGVQELAEAHRSGRPSRDDVVGLTFFIEERNYRLLLGLRQARSWAAVRPRAFEAAFLSLQRAFGSIVCDIDAVFEGESETGSIDVEERHVLSRTAASSASVAIAVGRPGLKLSSLVRVVTDLRAFGVPAGRIIPVINRAPRAPRAKAELARTFAGLVPEAAGAGLPSPIFLPDRPVERALRDGVRLPTAITGPLVGAYQAVLRRDRGLRSRDEGVGHEPELVRPGSLGSWAELDGDELDVRSGGGFQADAAD